MIECHHFADSEDIYNPFSLLNSLSDKMFGSYWFETATPTFLIERIDGESYRKNILDRMNEIARSDFWHITSISDDHLSDLLAARVLHSGRGKVCDRTGGCRVLDQGSSPGRLSWNKKGDRTLRPVTKDPFSISL